MGDPKCPKCGLDCVLVTEEVDIGVGVQEHILGWDCSHCGPISACNECGAPEFKHHPWCKEVPQLDPGDLHEVLDKESVCGHDE